MLQISSVNSFDYHTATLLGLMPAQAINAYLGSKLRSIHDVINDNHTAMAGYGMFIFEVSARSEALYDPLLNAIFILMTPTRSIFYVRAACGCYSVYFSHSI
jgi:hypothetical protein